MKSDFRRLLLRVMCGWVAYGLAWVGLLAPFSAFSQTSTNRSAKTTAPVSASVFRSMGSGPTRIAVLLETQSQSFGKAAAAVIAGIKSAHARDGQGITVDVISVSDSGDDVDQLVNALPSRGYSFVIGPLTRNGANALADRGALPLPVLVLNHPVSAPQPGTEPQWIAKARAHFDGEVLLAVDLLAVEA